MKEEDFKEILKERIRIAEETQDEWDYGIEQCRKKEKEILLKDINETIDFIKNGISDETFYWLSEVFADVAEKTQSVNFYNVVKERIKTVQDAEYKRSISVELEFMAGAIEADVNQGELPL